MPPGYIETLSTSLSRQLAVDCDYVWFVPSDAVREGLRQATLVSLPVPTRGMGEPIDILIRVDVQLSQAMQIPIAAIRKTVPF